MNVYYLSLWDRRDHESWRMGAEGAKQNQTKPNDSLHFVAQTEIIIQNNKKITKLNRIVYVPIESISNYHMSSS